MARFTLGHWVLAQTTTLMATARNKLLFLKQRIVHEGTALECIRRPKQRSYLGLGNQEGNLLAWCMRSGAARRGMNPCVFSARAQEEPPICAAAPRIGRERERANGIWKSRTGERLARRRD